MSTSHQLPNPIATAAAITEKPYFVGTITRVSTGETRHLDTRWSTRQIRWCMQNYGCNPDDLIAVGTSVDNARLTISAATFVVFWALAGVPVGAITDDFEQLLDLRQDQVLEEFRPELDMVRPDQPEEGEAVDPTDSPGSDG